MDAVKSAPAMKETHDREDVIKKQYEWGSGRCVQIYLTKNTVEGKNTDLIYKCYWQESVFKPVF